MGTNIHFLLLPQRISQSCAEQHTGVIRQPKSLFRLKALENFRNAENGDLEAIGEVVLGLGKLRSQSIHGPKAGFLKVGVEVVQGQIAQRFGRSFVRFLSLQGPGFMPIQSPKPIGFALGLILLKLLKMALHVALKSAFGDPLSGKVIFKLQKS